MGWDVVKQFRSNGHNVSWRKACGPKRHSGGGLCPCGLGQCTVTRRPANTSQGYNPPLHRGCRPTAMWAAA